MKTRAWSVAIFVAFAPAWAGADVIGPQPPPRGPAHSPVTVQAIAVERSDADAQAHHAMENDVAAALGRAWPGLERCLRGRVVYAFGPPRHITVRIAFDGAARPATVEEAHNRGIPSNIAACILTAAREITLQTPWVGAHSVLVTFAASTSFLPNDASGASLK